MLRPHLHCIRYCAALRFIICLLCSSYSPPPSPFSLNINEPMTLPLWADTKQQLKTRRIHSTNHCYSGSSQDRRTMMSATATAPKFLFSKPSQQLMLYSDSYRDLAAFHARLWTGLCAYKTLYAVLLTITCTQLRTRIDKCFTAIIHKWFALLVTLIMLKLFYDLPHMWFKTLMCLILRAIYAEFRSVSDPWPLKAGL